MKIVSFYEMAPGALSKVMDHYRHIVRGLMSSMRAVFCSWQGRLEILRKAQWQSSPPLKLQRNSSRATHS